MVFVPQHVADTSNLLPRDLRLLRLESRRNAAGSFRHDLDAALNAVAEKPVAPEVVECFALRGVLDAFDRLENGDPRIKSGGPGG